MGLAVAFRSELGLILNVLGVLRRSLTSSDWARPVVQNLGGGNNHYHLATGLVPSCRRSAAGPWSKDQGFENRRSRES